MSKDYEIRAAGPNDLTTLLELERACDEAPHWSEDVWLSLLQHHSSEVSWHAALIAQKNSEVIGFIVLSGSREVAELESIAVLWEFRARGVGKALCHSAVKVAVMHGAKSLELEVRSKSVAPRRLYASVGFIDQGVRKNYYRNPSDDAVLMSLALLDAEVQA